MNAIKPSQEFIDKCLDVSINQVIPENRVYNNVYKRTEFTCMLDKNGAGNTYVIGNREREMTTAGQIVLRCAGVFLVMLIIVICVAFRTKSDDTTKQS